MTRRIKEYRKKCKDAAYCRSISYDEFDTIYSILKDNLQTLKEPEIMDLLATISNIVLVNRQLHSLHFNPLYSNEMLEILVGLLDEHLKKQRGLIPKKRYHNRIAIYRLVFLILFDGKENNYLKLGLIPELNRRLKAWYMFDSENFHYFQTDQDYLMTVNELIKALYSLYHNYENELRANKGEMMESSDCLVIANELLTIRRLHGGVFTDMEKMVTKSILNFHLLIDSEKKDLKTMKEEDLDAYEKLMLNAAFFTSVEMRQYRKDEKLAGISSSSFLDGFAGGGGTQKVGLIDLLAVSAILQQNYKILHENILLIDESIQKNGSTDDQIRLHSKLMYLQRVMWDTFIPLNHSPNKNYLYNQFFQLVVLSNVYGGQLPASEVSHASNIKYLILAGYFQLCRPMNGLDPQDRKSKEELDHLQIDKFLELFGYTNSLNYLLNNSDIKITEEMKKKYLKPTSEFLVPDKWNVKPRPVHANDSMDLVDSLFNRGSYGSGSSRSTPLKKEGLEPPVEEMTEEEKELEAEKLFTLLSRVEKNPVFEGFVNPIREWQQSGKFENIN